jgi:hypothetical protein
VKPDNFVVRIYKNEELIEQRFAPELKVAAYFVESKAYGDESIWGEVFELNADAALLVSYDGSIEPATEVKNV